MDRAVLDGAELEYQVHGSGEPVVLIHPGMYADWFTPLLGQRVLTSRYRLVHYHRVGCAGSSRVACPLSLSQHAAHCRSLMRSPRDRAGATCRPVLSGNMALQMALDATDVSAFPAILEPAIYSGAQCPELKSFVGAAVQLYRAATGLGRLIRSCAGVCGSGYVRCWIGRSRRIRTSRGRRRHILRSECPRPAVGVPSAGREDASRITPAGVGGGEHAEPGARIRFGASGTPVLLDWLHNVEPLCFQTPRTCCRIETTRHGRGVGGVLRSPPARRSS